MSLIRVVHPTLLVLKSFAEPDEGLHALGQKRLVEADWQRGLIMHATEACQDSVLNCQECLALSW